MNPPKDPGEVGLMPKPLLFNTAKAHCPGCPGEASQRHCALTRVRPTIQDVLERLTKTRVPIHQSESTTNPPGCPGEARLRQTPLCNDTSTANHPGCPGVNDPRPEPRFTKVSVQLTPQDVLERPGCGKHHCVMTQARPTTQDVLE